MDIISHGLWGTLAFGRKTRRRFFIAFLFGIAPDLLSFGIFFVSMAFGFSDRHDFSAEPPHADAIPTYVHYLYNVTHSVIFFAVLFIFLWILFRKPIMESLAWGAHILLDIPTHSYEFFPTPFLWPFSDLKVDGIPWTSPFIFIPNVVLLIVFFGWMVIVYRKKRKAL